MPQFHAIVQGHVQGVGFRVSAASQARQLGLTGWVRNLPDDTVETVAAGPRRALEQYLFWLHKGPYGALVMQVDCQWSETEEHFNLFTIRYDAE
jgi:acylphosphatase